MRGIELYPLGSVPTPNIGERARAPAAAEQDCLLATDKSWTHTGRRSWGRLHISPIAPIPFPGVVQVTKTWSGTAKQNDLVCAGDIRHPFTVARNGRVSRISRSPT